MPKTAKANAAAAPIAYEYLSDAQFREVAQSAYDDFDRLPKAKQRALLIEWDILNPDGTLRRYPMNHVPLGPRG